MIETRGGIRAGAGRKVAEISERVPVIGTDVVKLSPVSLIGTSLEGPLLLPVLIKDGLEGARKKHGINLEPLFQVWVVDQMVAKRLAREAQKLLDKASRRLMGDWFSVDVEWGARVILFAARQSGIRVYSQKDIDAISMTREELHCKRLEKIANMGGPRLSYIRT